MPPHLEYISGREALSFIRIPLTFVIKYNTNLSQTNNILILHLTLLIFLMKYYRLISAYDSKKSHIFL